MVPIIEGGRNSYSGGGVVLLVNADVRVFVPTFCHSLMIENADEFGWILVDSDGF